VRARSRTRSFSKEGRAKRFSLVLANFPFSDDFWWLKPEQQTDDKKKKEKLKKEVFGKEGYKDPFGRFGRGTGFKAPPAAYGDYAFILHIVASLTDDGRAGIVCPQGVLFRGQPELEEEMEELDEGNPKLKRRKGLNSKNTERLAASPVFKASNSGRRKKRAASG
jgi:type I restriction enzyme M protein